MGNTLSKRWKLLLREPLVHFLLIGAGLFLYSRWSGSGAGPASTRIVLGSAQLANLAAGYARTWQRPPTEMELKGLVDDWVREEISVREATSAGLDRDDTVIRRRLRQKFEFLVEEVAEVARPTDKELQEWLAAHVGEFRTDPRVSFRQVYLSPDRRGASVEADARQLLARLSSAGAGAQTEEWGDSTILPRELELTSVRDVGRTFGEQFARRIGALPAGRWMGPIESSYGLHLVQICERVEGETPDLALIRPAVEREFLAERRKRQLNATYDRLLKKYIVVVERAKGSQPSAGHAKGTQP